MKAIRNNVSYFRCVLFSLIMLLSTACLATERAPQPLLSNTEMSSPIPASPTPTMAASLLPTQKPALTRVIPSLSPTRTQTASPPPTLVRRNCIPLSPGLGKDVTIQGVVIMAGGFYGKQSYLLNLASGKRTFLPEDPRVRLQSFVVSPDHIWLAYKKPNINLSESKLVVMKADGTPAKVIPWEESWRQISGWLDEKHLLISKRIGERFDSQADSLVVLDPFSGEKQELLPDFPGMGLVNTDWYGVGWEGFAHSGTVYDPSLTRVIYYKYSDAISLLDLQSRKELVYLHGGFGDGPKWRPDGSGFIINLPEPAKNLEGGHQWYSGQNGSLWYIDRDGNAAQLTHLQAYADSYDIRGYQWSPDGRQVAFHFWANTSEPYPDIYPDTDPLSSNRLAILDLATGLIKDTCIPTGHSDGDVVWSPDGQYILIDNVYKEMWPEKGRVFLVSLNLGVAVQLAEDAGPVGWLKDN